LRGVTFETQVFAWPTLEAAHAYRLALNGSGWADIWAFEDHGRSVESAAMSGGEQARVLAGDVSREDLELVHRAEDTLSDNPPVPRATLEARTQAILDRAARRLLLEDLARDDRGRTTG
jgi:hypothetical protein